MSKPLRGRFQRRSGFTRRLAVATLGTAASASIATSGEGPTEACPSVGGVVGSAACSASADADNDTSTVPGSVGAAGDTWKLSAGSLIGSLEVELLRTSNNSISWGSVRWIPTPNQDEPSAPSKCGDELRLTPLFQARLRKGAIRNLDSRSCTLVPDVPIEASQSSFSAQLECLSGLRVAWRAEIGVVDIGEEHMGGAVLRIKARLFGGKGTAPESLTLLLVPSGPCTEVLPTSDVNGSPVFVNDRFFVAAEHPLAKNNANVSTLPSGLSFVAHLDHLGARTWSSRHGFEYGAVLGAIAEKSQARRVFAAYINAARPSNVWQGPLVHYNSWFDFTSWQDQGFFGPGQARNAKEAKAFKKLLRELSKDQMHEKSVINVITAFGEELVQKRGVKVDSFLWDDGWDDPEEDLWAFNRDRFPNGFKKVASAADAIGSGNGIWLSPWGGYGDAKDRRVEMAKAQGYETNKNGLNLAGKKYFKRFKQAAQSMQRDSGVNFFKFDGVAGDPSEVTAEMEAMLALAADLRMTDEEKKIWINLTTGTWPSPFFLLWVDSIWRGHRDTLVIPEKQLMGQSNRQRWQIFRECVVHEYIARRAVFFPLARLMIHGAILAQHGDARAHGLHEASELDWAQEIWSHASMGLLLQELYISAELMTAARWDALAEALKWSRKNSKTLEDTHWALRATCVNSAFRPHGWAAWRQRQGFLTLRNPRAEGRAWTSPFTLAQVLELPAATQSGPQGEERELVVEVVKRLASDQFDFLEFGTNNCSFLEGARDLSDSDNIVCGLGAKQQTRVSLKSAEVLILQISL